VPSCPRRQRGQDGPRDLHRDLHHDLQTFPVILVTLCRAQATGRRPKTTTTTETGRPLSLTFLTSARFAVVHSVHVERRRSHVLAHAHAASMSRHAHAMSRPRHVVPTPWHAHATLPPRHVMPTPRRVHTTLLWPRHVAHVSHVTATSLSRWDLYKTCKVTGSAKGPVKILQFFG
jgi:hypothetical protein